VNDLGKIGVIAAIMGALLLFGLLLNPLEPATIEQEELAPAVEPVTEVTVLPPTSLEMLDPIYSEKAVFQDDTIRIAFNISHTEEGVESRLPFWIHNVSGDVISILWDRCSIQLPCGNTVNVINEEGLAYGGSISIAPAGDLFDAVIPITEIVWEEEPIISTGVLDQATFTFVLAIDRGVPKAVMAHRMGNIRGEPPPGCEPVVTTPSRNREVIFYTFRFVIR
jgi:hypothetical protein